MIVHRQFGGGEKGGHARRSARRREIGLGSNRRKAKFSQGDSGCRLPLNGAEEAPLSGTEMELYMICRQYVSWGEHEIQRLGW